MSLDNIYQEQVFEKPLALGRYIQLDWINYALNPFAAAKEALYSTCHLPGPALLPIFMHCNHEILWEEICKICWNFPGIQRNKSFFIITQFRNH